MTTSYREMLDNLKEREFLLIRTRAMRVTIFQAGSNNYIFGMHLDIKKGYEVQAGMHFIDQAGAITMMGRFEEDNAKWAVCLERE